MLSCETTVLNPKRPYKKKKILCWGQGFEFSLESKCFIDSGLLYTYCVCAGVKKRVDSSSTSYLCFIGIDYVRIREFGLIYSDIGYGSLASIFAF